MWLVFFGDRGLYLVPVLSGHRQTRPEVDFVDEDVPDTKRESPCFDPYGQLENTIIAFAGGPVLNPAIANILGSAQTGHKKPYHDDTAGVVEGSPYYSISTINLDQSDIPPNAVPIKR